MKDLSDIHELMGKKHCSENLKSNQVFASVEERERVEEKRG